MHSKAKAKAKKRKNKKANKKEERFPVVVDKRQEGLNYMKSCLANPYLHLGSQVKEKVKLWVYENNEMVYRKISYVPAVFRMFNEILLNAFDNKQVDPSMDSLEVSFANSVATSEGGTHVDHITDQITTYLINKVNEKNKDADVKADDAKNHLWVFVNALVYNPIFGSGGTMERLNTSQASFGSKLDVPESVLEDVAEFGIVEKLLDLADCKRRIALMKKKADEAKTPMICGSLKLEGTNDTGGRKYLKKADETKTPMIGGIVKLEDTNDTGGRNSEMTQLEHILLRPDSLLSSVEKNTQNLWVYENDKWVYRSISYVPALYKIFDDILVTVVHNKQRDPSMDSLKVTIEPEANTISVYNNGDGVPVEIHPEEKVYVPELIFGRLLTSSNNDLNVKKTTGVWKGCGAKLTNIFLTEFVVEIADGRRLKKYKQVFTNNMEKSDPEITECEANENWTKVTFKPDLEKFKMAYLEEDVVVLMKTRVMEMAVCLGNSVKVEVDGSLMGINCFKDYVDLYSVEWPAAEAGKAAAPNAKAPAATKKRKH